MWTSSTISPINGTRLSCEAPHLHWVLQDSYSVANATLVSHRPLFALMASTREVLTFLDLEEDIHV